MDMIARIDTRRRNGLILGLIIVVMAHLTAANPGRIDESWRIEPWPMLLTNEPVSIDPSIVALHRRASGSLEKLVLSAGGPQQPL